VLLEVDQGDLLRSMNVQLRDDVRRILRETRVPAQGGIQPLPRGVQFRVAEAARGSGSCPKLRELSQPITNPCSARPAPATSTSSSSRTA
jgi:preprotein translocase subunit SecD